MADSNKRILIAEDNKFFQSMLATELAKHGYQVDVANNGKEALDLARQNKPDLAVVDLIMPVMDGFDTISEFKQDPSLKSVKIIVSSNLSQEEDINKVKELGADSYIVKQDMSFEDTVNKIKAAID